MSNLTSFGGGLPANPDDLINSLSNVTRSLRGSAGGTPILKLKKSGAYAYGQEGIEPELESEWAVNPYSIQHGWACWIDNELRDEIMVPFNQTPPTVGELADYGEPWSQQVSVLLQCMNGEDEGVVVIYKGTSLGLRNAMTELTNAIVLQAQTDPAHVVPVVTLDVDSYQHKKYGEIFTPVLAIERWISIDGVAQPEAVEDQPDGAPEEEGDDVEGELIEEAVEVVEEPKSTRRGSASSQRRGGRQTGGARTATASAAAKEPEQPTASRRRRRRA